MAILPALKNWGVPQAAPTGRRWPVPAQPKIVAYTRADGAVVGNAATRFHASRENGSRYHAAMDLVCAPGDPVVAMEAGRVIGMISGFVRLGAVVVAHPTAVAVYAEIDLNSLAIAKLKPGDPVVAGQLIGRGAVNYEGRSMLHLELWAPGHAPAAYTPWRAGSPPPAGLLDPSAYLIALAALAAGDAPVAGTGAGAGAAIAVAAVAIGLGALLFGSRH